MGLFDKLLGKKEKTQTYKTVDQPIYSTDFSSDILKQLQSFSKEEKEVKPDPYVIIHPVTYEEVEDAIAKNPLSPLYRDEEQRKTFSLKNTLTLEQFIKNSKWRFVAVDFETTGLNATKDKIVEICAVKVDQDQILDIYHQYINPNMLMPSEATAVNHITDYMLGNKPYIYEVLPDFLDFVHGEILVAHNAEFEIKFLAQACLFYRFKTPRKWFDSMDLTEVWPGLINRKQETFLEAAGIVNENPHTAAGDAEALANLMIKTKEKIQNGK